MLRHFVNNMPHSYVKSVSASFLNKNKANMLIDAAKIHLEYNACFGIISLRLESIKGVNFFIPPIVLYY